jgi:ADP-ribose pyrophosphatase
MSQSERNARLEAYLAFARTRPELFETPPGGVRVLLEPAEIEAIETRCARELEAQGLPPSGAEVGVVFQDPWFYVLRDAVEFPDGSRRTHARTLNRIGNGAAVLPMLDGRIVVERQFRHAARRWMLEIPRGGIEPGESAEEAARKEVLEEIGGRVRNIQQLGFLLGSGNLYYNGAYLFYAELDGIGEPQLGEAIAAIELFTPAEFEQRLLAGEILDSFTVAAYTHAKLRGLL